MSRDRRLLPALSLIFLGAAMSGCIGDDAPEHSRQGSHDHGVFFTCPDGTRIDPGDYGDHHMDTFDAASKCPEPAAPAKVTIALGADTLERFDFVELRWDVTPASRADGNVALTGVWVSNASKAVTGTDPEAYGTAAAQVSASEAPAEHVAGWRAEQAGTFYFRAFAKVDGQGVWSEEVPIQVQQIEPTGVMHRVAVTGAGPAAMLENATLTIEAGDAVLFVNDDVVAHRFVTTEAPDPFQVQVALQETSAPIVFLELGDYVYENQDDPELVALMGQITVEAPPPLVTY